jgi:hypothetical protein
MPATRTTATAINNSMSVLVKVVKLIFWPHSPYRFPICGLRTAGWGGPRARFPCVGLEERPAAPRDPAHQEPTVARPQWPPGAARAGGNSPRRRHPAQTASSFSALPGPVQCTLGTKAECVRRRGFRELSGASSAVHDARSAARRNEPEGGIRAAGLRRGAPAGAGFRAPPRVKLAQARESVGPLLRRTGLLPFNLQLVHHLLHVWHPGRDLFCARSLL